MKVSTVTRVKLRPRAVPSVLFSALPFMFLLAIWPFGGGSKVVMTNSPSAPAAKGIIHVSHDNNGNTKIDMDIHYLAEPDSLTPAESTYVVWVQANGEAPQNKGELKVSGDRSASMNFVTPLKRFDVFVTAEKSALATAPTGDRVLSANISR